MEYLVKGCLVVLAITLSGMWLYMLYDTLRDAMRPKESWQQQWKWRMAALLVNITILAGGILVIVLVTAIMMEINKVT